MKLNFWPFNRNQDQDSTLPEEVKDYYQAEKRERTSVASLLAIGTLVATIVLALGLFFGGRWVYRTVFNGDSGTTDTAEQRGDDQQEVGSNGQDVQGDGQGEGTAPQQDAQTPSDTPNPTPTPTPAAGPLPRTGPDQDL